MKIYKLISYFAFGLLFGSVNVNAQGVKMFTDRAPSAEEMGDILFSEPTDDVPKMRSTGIKMRSISFGKPKNSAKALPEPTVTSQTGAAVGLPIKFAYNSAEVLEESKPFLNEIGRMLNLPEFSSERLIVEGHTDSSGANSYNMYLSKKRAQSVKYYLQSSFNITSNRLQVVGMGESQSLPGESPRASINRRVQFRKAH